MHRPRAQRPQSHELHYCRHIRRLPAEPSEFTLTCLISSGHFHLGASLPGLRVQQVLDRLKEMQGLPISVILDNRPEFAGKVLAAKQASGCHSFGLVCRWRITYIESINGRFHDDCLNEHLFASMRHVMRPIEKWRGRVHTERLHSSLGDLTPAQFARAHDATQRFLTSDSICNPD